LRRPVRIFALPRAAAVLHAPAALVTAARVAAAAVTAAVVTAAIVAAPAAADPVEYLPPSHWAYDDLTALWNRGLVDSLNVATRPWSRVEIARALARVAGGDRGDPVFLRLERQFARELAAIGAEAPAETPPLLSLRDGDSEARLVVGADGRAAGTPPGDARFAPGSGVFLRGRAWLAPGGFVLAEVRAQRTGLDRGIGDSLVKNRDFYLDTGEAYVTVSPAGFEMLFGLAETRWGPGRTGTLLLSDAADPFAVLRLRRKFAGRLELSLFHGTLVQSDNRHVAMHRLSLRVSPALTLGFAEAARYDARSPELLYLLNLVPYTLVERFSQKHAELPPEISQRNNVMMAADVTWRFRRDASLWAEFLLDDLATETADMPHRMAWQAGAALSFRLGRWPAEAMLEHTKVFRFTYAVSYDRDYIFSGRPLGYADGPDAERYALRLRADPAEAWTVALDAGLLRRGEGFLGEFWDAGNPLEPWSGASLTGTVESAARVTPSAAWTPRDNVRVRAGAGVVHVRNADHVRDRSRTDPEAFVELMVHR
jgi:hypothetical protein